ncbi:hypothetical protein [Sedimentibacter sp. MB31-C6]|uniref:hypothetical protein n=1 Tax=Sedimentibacter sp. MB31-C6 TaxID=3109366 RepID=UPI002DDD70BC|nr:hypothetical protein [Sedimentibacter sp. MB36-C1]WSI03472.1 hypothetical protein U8307_10470 [Sedimentibacter sp. MB36-C1]
MYIVFDLEFNQNFCDESVKKINRYMFPFEIIQIGAIKLDSNLNVVDSFSRYIRPGIYNPNYIKPRIKQPKKIIDIEALFKQFEKMYNRIISEEEKSMIILAYKMGKTSQFLKDKNDNQTLINMN